MRRFPTSPVMPTSPLSLEEIRERSRLTKEEWREYTKTVWQIANVTHPFHPAPFPVEIPRRLIKLFSLYGETVLDPFAGKGTTAEAALALCRRVVCIEQNPEFAQFIQSEYGLVRKDLAGLDVLQVVQGDSRKLEFMLDNSVDLVVTSPPYWNKADYGTSVENLGTISQYQYFLRELRLVFKELFRVLVPGRKICIVTANVNQYTDHGLLTFPLATDFNSLLREIGFVMTTEVIWNKDGTGGKWGSFGQQRPIFGSYPYPPNFLFKNIHEYVLVWSKPGERRNGNPKALPYEWLMANPE